jgi:drug/metabolite transporter (DMT)-like permease
MGELAALLAALFWTIASVIYGRWGQPFDPMGLNFFKGAIALLCLLLTPMLWGSEGLTVLRPVPVCLLAASGAIGIGVGDTVYFEALQRLGPRQTLLLTALGPALATGVAWLSLGETLSGWDGLGIGITVGGIIWVVRERRQSSAMNNSRSETIAQRKRHTGIVLALLAAGCEVAGAVLARAVLADSLVRPEWAAVARISAGLGVLTLWGGLRQQLVPWFRTIVLSPQFKMIGLAAFLGTYLGIWLQQVGLKYASSTGVAQTLGATSPLLVLPLALWMGESVSVRAWVGALVAVMGIGILFLT